MRSTSTTSQLCITDVDCPGGDTCPVTGRGLTASTTRSAVGVKAYGARQGIPPQTSTTTPFACRNSDFCVRALGWLRGSSWGSWPPGGGVFVVGGGQVQSASAGFGQLSGVLQ